MPPSFQAQFLRYKFESTDRMRNVIVHYHVFKNAGTTVDAALGRRFGGKHSSVEGEYPWDTITSKDVLDFVLKNPDLEAVSSHTARFPVPTHAQVVIHPLLFLRHPIDRVASIYRFEAKQPADSLSPSVEVAKSTDLRGFVEWGLSERGTAVFRNFQTIYLASRERDMRFARANLGDYLVAAARLNEIANVGVVDEFEATARQIETALLAKGIALPLSGGGVENSTAEGGLSLSERLAQISDQLGEALLARLMDENRFDMRLYEMARWRSMALAA